MLQKENNFRITEEFSKGLKDKMSLEVKLSKSSSGVKSGRADLQLENGKDTHWVFTDYGHSGAQTDLTKCNFEDYEQAFGKLKDKVLGLAWGLEQGKNEKKWHRQVFIQFNKRQSYTAIRKIVGHKGYHAQRMRGSIEQNKIYCSKDGEFQILGEFSDKQQGARSDLTEIAEELISGETSVDKLLTPENFTLFHQYGRTIEKYEDKFLLSKKRTTMTKGYWFWGGTGTGKSHMFHNTILNSPDEDHYVWNLKETFQCEYKHQRCTLIDDFRGELSIGELCKIVDKWNTCKIARKGRAALSFTSEVVCITCPMKPQDLFKNAAKEDKLEQLFRRFKIISVNQKRTEVVKG